jgi:hypothetical protein
LVFKHRWDPQFIGWQWNCGEIQVPSIPLLSTSGLLYSLYNSSRILRASPWALAATLGIDASIFTSMILYQYYVVEENIHMVAPKLALDIISYSKKYHNVRIICHSMGCKLLLSSLPYVPEKNRPTYIHLCAPAFSEGEYMDILNNSSKERTYIYYNPNDVVLSTVLHATKNKFPVGAYGLKEQYSNVEQVNVAEYFKDEWLIHNNYPKLSHRFIVNDSSQTPKFPF